MSENPPKYQKKSVRKKRFVLFSWITAAIMFLVVAAFFSISYYAVDILRFTLKEGAKTESGGFYSVHFSDLKFSLLKKQFVIKDFEIKPDTSFHDTATQPQKIYNISIETFLLNGVDILHFLSDKKVEISDFSIDNPKIEILSYDSTEVHKPFPKERLLKFLNVSKDFEIDKFDITNATIRTVSIRPEDTVVQDFKSISINYFDDNEEKKDSSKKLRLINDNCIISVGKNSFQSADGRFSLDFEKMSLRGENRKILLKDATIVLRDSNLKVSSDIKLKELEISEIDFFALVYDNTLLIDSFRIAEPKLLMNLQKSKSKKFELPVSYAAIMGDIFDSVSCKSFDIDDFDILLVNAEKDSIKIEKVDLKLQNIFLDSVSYAERAPHFFCDSIKIELPKQEFWLKGVDNPLSFGSFQFDVITGKLEIDNFFVDFGSQNGDKNFSALKLNIDIDNPFNYLKNRVLKLSSLKVLGGDLQFDNFNNKPKQNNKNDIVKALNSAANKIADTLQILNLDFEFKKISSNLGNSTEIVAGPNGLLIQDLRFPIKKRELLNRPFCSFQMHWQANSLRYRDDTTSISCKYLSLNSRRTGALTIDDLQLLKTNKQNDSIFSSSISRIDVEDFDFGELFYREKIELQTFSMLKPKLFFQAMSDKKVDSSNLKTVELPFPITIDCIKILEGGVKALIVDKNHQKDIAVERFDLEVDGFSTGKIVVDKNLFNGDISGFRWKSYNHSLNFSDTEDIYKIDKFQLSSYDSLFRFVNIYLDIVQQGVEMRLNLPSFSFFGFDMNKMLKQHQFVSSEVKMDKGVLDVLLSDNWQKSIQKNEKVKETKSNSISDFIQSVKIDRYTIDSAQVRFQVANNEMKHSFKGDYLNFNLKDFYFDANKSTITKNTFINQDFALTLSDYKFYLQDSVYKAEFKSMELSTSPPALKLKGLAIEPIKELPDSLIKADIHLEELILSDINWDKLISQKKIDFRKLIIEKPTATIDLPVQKRNHKKVNEPFVKKLGSISNVTLDSLFLNNGKFKIRKLNRSDLDLDIEYFALDNLHLDTTHSSLSDPFAFVDDYEIKTRELDLDLGKMMKMHLDAIELSTAKELVIIDSLCLIPRYPKVEYSNILGYETDWTLLKTSSITLDSVDFEKYFNENYLSIQKISVDGMNLVDFRDKRLPMRPDFFPPMPMEGLKKIPIGLFVDSLKINEGYVKYEEQGVYAKNVGMIHLDSLNAIIYNITNDSLLLATGTDMIIDANAKLMNDGAFNFHCRMFGDDSLQGFRASGGMSTMDLTLLDTIIEPLGFIDIRSGNADFLSFQWDGNRKNAIGKMTFLYKDLKIGLIDKKKLRADAGDNILAFLANTFVIRKNNPKWFIARKGGIYFERDAQKSIFNYWAKSAISGAKSSIGLGKNKPKREEKRAAKKRARRNRKLRK